MKSSFILLFSFLSFQFFADAQNIGIGTTTPGAKLHVFNGSSGYASTYLPGAVIENNNSVYFNLLTPDGNESGMLFGKASSAAHGGIVYNNPSTSNGLQFRTNGNNTQMVIDQSGNVGIGLSNPVFKLDVADRIRIRSGGGFSTAGLYLNSNDNSSSPAFIGMDDDTHVGFWGSGTGWKFSMNTQTGALKINGSEGSSGQVLASSGSGAPQWVSSTNTLYNNTVSVVDQTGLTLGSSGGAILLPGMSNSFSLSGNAKVFFSYHIPVHTIGCSFCGSNNIYIDFKINGNLHSRCLWTLANNTSFNLSFSKVIFFGPGNYNFQLFGLVSGPADVNFGGCCIYDKIMNIQIIPQ